MDLYDLIWFDCPYCDGVFRLEKEVPNIRAAGFAHMPRRPRDSGRCPEFERLAKTDAWHELPLAVAKKSAEESTARAAASQHTRMWCR